MPRGRPKVFTDEWLTFLQGLYPDLHSRRGLQDRAYQVRALRALRDTDFGDQLAYRDKWHMRSSLLAALGRFPDDDGGELIREVARQVYEAATASGNWNTKFWVRVLTEHRQRLFSEAASENNE